MHSRPAPRTPSGFGELAEYRRDEWAHISGDSARNIRAYRVRGLLDPPRRVGRSAVYDDHHLSQLRTINQLHRRGFSSAHIAEFFASLRQGTDLADILGIQRAVLGPRSDHPGAAPAPADALDIAAHSDEARRLRECGLADLVSGVVVLTDPAMRRVVARASDQLGHVRALLHIFEATGGAIDALAGGFVQVLDECVAARFGADYAPGPTGAEELGRAVRDYRDLWTSVVSTRLDKALQEHLAADTGHSAPLLLSGREPEPR